jgi:hypothetical protein
MSASPVFFITPRVAGVNSGASANSVKTLAGTNNTVAVIAGTANGSIINRVSVVQNGTGASTANNICRFYIFDGTSYYLVHEVNLGGAVTPSATVVGIRISVPELVGLKLPTAAYVLHVGFSAAAAGDTFTITAEVADL